MDNKCFRFTIKRNCISEGFLFAINKDEAIEKINSEEWFDINDDCFKNIELININDDDEI